MLSFSSLAPQAPLTLRAETSVPLDLEGEGERAGDVEVPDTTTGTFSKALTSLEEECKAATKRLYEGDGKQSALGPDGIPDSLCVWLQERRDKALGPNGTRVNSCNRFADTVRRLETAVGKAVMADAADEKRPIIVTRAALEDIMARARADLERDRDKEEADFELKLHDWEQGREKHRRSLR
jgi:hypothetical protein